MKRRYKIRTMTFALALCVSGVRAQDQQQNSQSASPVSPIPPLNSGGSGGNSKPPIPAARGVSGPSDAQTDDPAQAIPDTNTLSGAQLFTVGSLGQARNVFSPSFSFSELGQVASGVGGGLSNMTSQTLLSGNLNFNRTWNDDRLTVIYNGGETFFKGPGVVFPRQQFHELTATQQITWERWRLTVFNDFVASPGAAFGGTGMGGPGMVAQLSATLGASLNTVGQAFIPGEYIQTGNAMRYRNTVLGQVEYSLSRRSAFTFSGSYGLLHFSDSGYVNSNIVNAQAGYDYQLDPKNSIAIIGGYGKINYPGTTDSTTEYMAGLAYGMKITGRLAFQVGAGPQQIRLAFGNQDSQRWFESVNSSLTYERRRSGVSLNYLRGLGNGSGVFMGATTNTVSGTAHHAFTRFWNGAVTGGYAINNSLAQPGVAATRFDNWFIGSNLGRQVGRHAVINFNYGLQVQGNPGTCPVASCGGNGYQQTFGMSINWRLRPAG